jgi:ABC-type bacteriocin/lantibiotic exporter with double-glycine peptidase domain
MVLDYLGVPVDEARLRRRLGTTEEGTPFSNIARLQALGLFVHAAKRGDLSIFEHYFALGLPVIVGVETLGWQHWGEEVTRHAVVVVGIDRENSVIYIHDPFFAQAPIDMSFVEFEVGWIEGEGDYAVLGLAPPEDQS